MCCRDLSGPLGVSDGEREAGNWGWKAVNLSPLMIDRDEELLPSGALVGLFKELCKLGNPTVIATPLIEVPGEKHQSDRPYLLQ
jgi:hypothetical protein